MRLSHGWGCGPILLARILRRHTDRRAGLSNQLNPALGVIRYIYWNGSAHYNGLNVNLDKKFSHGLQFQVAYTFSKSLDDTSQTIAGDTFGNGINSPWWFLPQAFYGPSDFNVAHTLSINALYTIPTPKTWNGAMKEALAGWEVGGIFTYNSGTPTTPINQGDPLGLGNGGADQFGPVVKLPGANAVSTAGSVPGQPNWINPAAFTEPYMPTSFANSLVGTNYQCDANCRYEHTDGQYGLLESGAVQHRPEQHHRSAPCQHGLLRPQDLPDHAYYGSV